MQRLKVKFPTLPDLESAWARVVTLGAGPKRGIDMRAEVGDEVLVGFENGDLRRPYVFGGLTHESGDEVEPAVKDKKTAVRSITSREGHRIELSDDTDDAKQFVKIVTKGKNSTATVSMKGVNITTADAASDGIVFTDGQAKITIKGGKVVIEAPNGIELKSASGNVKVEAMKVEMKGNTGVAIDGTTQTEVKGAQVSVNGSGMTEIKGGIVKIN
jgi:uncharacterized protein involved in type VI secretion and phage assembly